MFLVHGRYGLKESGMIKLISAAYALLSLNYIFHSRSQEVRAWTSGKKGWKAPQASRCNSHDFERGFIKAR